MLRLTFSVVVVTGTVAYTTIEVARSDYPIIRATEGVATLLAVMVLLFASTYFIMSRADAAAFSEVLDRTGALYFTLTTATTIGFGDITPSTESARVAVMVQMLVNVLLIGVGLRLLVNTAKRRARSA
jgi:voltage-gated potassium channel